MHIILRAAMVAVSLGSIGPAYAGEGEGGAADTRATEVPGLVAQAPKQSIPSPFESARNGQASLPDGTAWIFPPIGKAPRPGATRRSSDGRSYSGCPLEGSEETNGLQRATEVEGLETDVSRQNICPPASTLTLNGLLPAHRSSHPA